jgi:thiamine biosynthesis lipoprotein ApbE
MLAFADDRALGAGVRVAVTRPAAIGPAKRAVDEVLRAIDAACSRFRPDSEIVALNASPGADQQVSPLLARAVGAALDAARTTGGAVDPTVGTAVRMAGYDRDFAALPPRGGPIQLVAQPVPGWRSVRLDVARGTVRLPHGVEIDLGATAKALAADLAAEAAVAAVGGGVLVSLGGDVAVRGEAPPGGWRIQIGEDSGASVSEDEEAVTITDGGLATSSTTVRRWMRGGVELHHIIDPHTGMPARGPWRTATVAAATCVEANTAATAAIVLGAGAVPWLAGAHLPARLVDRRGHVHRAGGWPRRRGEAR